MGSTSGRLPGDASALASGRTTSKSAKARRALAHPVSQNAFALYWVQVATFIAPLVTLPYLSRVLGAHAFGLVVFSLSLSFVLGLCVDFGFPAWATRMAAALRNDRPALARLASRVLSAKLALSLGSYGRRGNRAGRGSQAPRGALLVLFAWVAAVANGLTPTWFFIGLERVKLISLTGPVPRSDRRRWSSCWSRTPGDGWSCSRSTRRPPRPRRSSRD